MFEKQINKLRRMIVNGSHVCGVTSGWAGWSEPEEGATEERRSD